MKVTVLVFVVFAALSSVHGKGLNQNINKIVDGYMDSLSQFVVEHRFDPTALPDRTQDFSFKPALITHHGQLVLTKGWMQDLRTLTRGGTSYLNFVTMTVKLPLLLEKIEFGYDYLAKVMFTRPSGQALGNVQDLEMYIEVSYNALKGTAKLKACEVSDIGQINLKLTGSPLLDWWANAFIKSITKMIHDDVVDAVDVAVNEIAELIIEKINNRNKFDINAFNLTSLAHV